MNDISCKAAPTIDADVHPGKQFSTLSTRAKNALHRRKISTIDELRAFSIDEISTFMGIGENTLNEIKALLANKE